MGMSVFQKQSTTAVGRRPVGWMVARCGLLGLCVWGGMANPCEGAKPIRNVILCIGDGMGPGQVAAARCFKGANLFFETLPAVSPSVSTLNVYGGITDSAAAATAMATGRKVSNGTVSLAVPGDGVELQTVLEYFQLSGKRAGLVTTSYLTDATPACFGAHEASRYNSAGIASDYLNQTRPDVLLGGGATGLDRAVVEAAGYVVVSNAAALAELDAASSQPVCGLFGAGYLPFEYDGLGELPRLCEMTAKALNLLNAGTNGFILVVEGGLIDIACHGNDLERCIYETLALDATVEGVVAWAAGRDDTLVLVTADHETGGLVVTQDNGPRQLPDVVWSGGGHTATPVSLYAWGANAEFASGVTDNTQISGVAKRLVLEPGDFAGFQQLDPYVAVPQWAAASGSVYRVEYEPQLDAASWQVIGVVTAQNARVTLAHTNLVPQASGFYRMIPEAP